MRKILKNLFFVTLPSILIMLLLLELVFRFIIPSANGPNWYFDQTEKIIRFDTEHNTKGTYSIGKLAQQKAKWSINNFGWNSSYNYQKERTGKKRIAVIGDSFIEAVMVNNTDIYPSKLHKLLDDSADVYGFGIAGAPFSQYLHMSRYVVKNFNPDVLIINICHNDFYESLEEHAAQKFFKSLDIKPDSSITEVEPVPYHLSPLKSFLKHSALVRYIGINLKGKESLQHLFASKKNDTDTTYNANINVDKTVLERSRIELAIDYICRKLKEENPGKRIILVMDGSRYDIYNGTLEKCNVCFLNQITQKYAAKHQLEYIDLTEVFNADYKRNKKKFNFDQDSHWNEYGHQMVADTLYKYLTTK